MKGKKRSTNRSVSRFLDDLDRREEERRRDLTKVLEQTWFDDERMEKVLGDPEQNQTQHIDEGG